MGSRLPIRWRLALWYSAFLALALLIVSVVIYVGLQRLLERSLDADLRREVATVLAVTRVEDGRLSVAEDALPRPADDQLIRVFDRDGDRIAERSRDLDEDDLNEAALAAGRDRALDGETDLRWVTAHDERLRVLSQPVRTSDAPAGVVQVGLSDDAVAEPLAVARRVLGVTAPLILLVASVGGVWLAGRALGPVDRMTRLAAAIEADSLSRRIDLPASNDEVGRLARTFNAMLDRIESAFQRQRQFTADAAHELRTPLALMQSQIELALRKPRDPEADQAVLTALTGDVERLTRLAGTLLLLARGDAQRLELEREQVDLAALIDLVAAHYRSRADEAGVTLILETEPVTLWADEDRLIQVLVNLVENALRYTPANRRITLGCRAEDGVAHLWVRDEGIGIAPEHLPHLFERFYRVEPGRERGQRGVGLGLSIVQAIVEHHGGTVTIASQPDEGATVSICLPLTPAVP